MRLTLAAVSLLTLLGASSVLAEGMINWATTTRPEFHNYLATPGPAQCYWYDRCYCRDCTRPVPSVFAMPVLTAPK
jgi:hypothetical protein